MVNGKCFSHFLPWMLYLVWCYSWHIWQHKALTVSLFIHLFSFHSVFGMREKLIWSNNTCPHLCVCVSGVLILYGSFHLIGKDPAAGSLFRIYFSNRTYDLISQRNEWESDRGRGRELWSRSQPVERLGSVLLTYCINYVKNVKKIYYFVTKLNAKVKFKSFC